MIFNEIYDHAQENFCHYVDQPSTRQKMVTEKDSYGRTIETTFFFKGTKVIGKQIRDFTGYRYFLRKD